MPPICCISLYVFLSSGISSPAQSTKKLVGGAFTNKLRWSDVARFHKSRIAGMTLLGFVAICSSDTPLAAFCPLADFSNLNFASATASSISFWVRTVFSRVVFSSLLSPAHDGNASSSCSTAALSAASIKRIVGDLRADKSLSVTRTKSDSAFTESASMPKKLRMELTNRLKKFALPSYPLAPSKNVCIASSLMPYARNSSRLLNTLAFLSSSWMYSGNCPAADNSSNRFLALSIVRCRS